MVVCGPNVEVQVLHPIETVIRGLQYNKLTILWKNGNFCRETIFIFKGKEIALVCNDFYRAQILSVGLPDETTKEKLKIK